MKLGIDPGWVNLGLAILRDDDTVEVSSVFNPRDLGGVCAAVDEIDKFLAPYWDQIKTVGIEKYVVYGGGVASSSQVEVNQLVGALMYLSHRRGFPAKMVRAIDWKPEVCKFLFKRDGFKNPSSKFDKKCSKAIAIHITKSRFKTNHEEDAVGIAFSSAL